MFVKGFTAAFTTFGDGINITNSIAVILREIEFEINLLQLMDTGDIGLIPGGGIVCLIIGGPVVANGDFNFYLLSHLYRSPCPHLPICPIRLNAYPILSWKDCLLFDPG